METSIEIEEVTCYGDMIKLYDIYSRIHDIVHNDFIKLKNFKDDIDMSKKIYDLYPNMSIEILEFLKPSFKNLLGEDYIYLDTESLEGNFVKSIFIELGKGTKNAFKAFIKMIKELIHTVFEKVKVAMNMTLGLTKLSVYKLNSWDKYISKLPEFHKKDFEMAQEEFYTNTKITVPADAGMLKNYIPITNKLMRTCDSIIKNDVDTRLIDIWTAEMELIGIPEPPMNTIPTIVVSNLIPHTLQELGFKPGFNGFKMAANDFTKNYRSFVLAYGKIKRKEKEYLSRVDSIFHTGYEEKTEDRRNELEKFCGRNFELIMGYLSCTMDIGVEIAKTIRLVVADYNNTMVALKNKKHL